MSRIYFFQSLLALFTFFYFLIRFLALTELNIIMWKQSMILHFSLQFFHFKTFCYRSRCWSWWGNLDRGQYPFQQIKFLNLVVPSPCQTEPYNKWTISLDSLCLIFFIPLLRFLFRFSFLYVSNCKATFWCWLWQILIFLSLTVYGCKLLKWQEHGGMK